MSMPGSIESTPHHQHRLDSFGMNDYSEIEPPPKELKGLAPILRKIFNLIKFAWEFLESVMISLTLILNKLSKDYRYVSMCLNLEKQRIKEMEGFSAIPVAPAIISQKHNLPKATIIK